MNTTWLAVFFCWLVFHLSAEHSKEPHSFSFAVWLSRERDVEKKSMNTNSNKQGTEGLTEIENKQKYPYL